MSVHPLPRATPSCDARLVPARVASVGDDACRLHPGAGIDSAGIAAGCLLRPQAGDTVLLLLCDPGPCLVLCVLERAGGDACVRLPGGSELLGDAQGLRLRAPQVDVLASSALRLQAPDLDMKAARCRLSSSTLELRTGRLSALLGSLHARGRECLTRLGRSVAELGDSVRRVRGMDETHASQQRVRIDERLHIDSRDTSIVARNHVRVDARRIDLG